LKWRYPIPFAICPAQGDGTHTMLIIKRLTKWLVRVACIFPPGKSTRAERWRRGRENSGSIIAASTSLPTAKAAAPGCGDDPAISSWSTSCPTIYSWASYYTRLNKDIPKYLPDNYLRGYTGNVDSKKILQKNRPGAQSHRRLCPSSFSGSTACARRKAMNSTRAQAAISVYDFVKDENWAFPISSNS
jgi:hypothetical protein